MDEIIRENTGNQTPDATAAENAGQSERMFTQDEVNKIVSDRLNREREKIGMQLATQQMENAIEQELNARESRLDCREFLVEKQYPVDLLDLLDTSDVEQFKAAAEKLHALYSAERNRARFVNPDGTPREFPDGKIPRFTQPMNHRSPMSGCDPVREAFKP